MLFLPSKQWAVTTKAIENIQKRGCFYPPNNGQLQLRRIETLLRRAMGKYVHGEKALTPHGDYGLDNQILLMQETILRAKANREELIRQSYAPDQADYNIALAEATLETLLRVKDERV